ncbi:hypothetical protein Hdeb2414_s0011g00359801 [Helianthus debilis subsp. tardiflorus]
MGWHVYSHASDTLILLTKYVMWIILIFLCYYSYFPKMEAYLQDRSDFLTLTISFAQLSTSLMS